ncbi:MAG: hypothetical protein QMD09_12390, partial [Desulfatibacillaceae bacterium]|nr:hypothetical protein [Desulfatibacillaceae bacterium]
MTHFFVCCNEKWHRPVFAVSEDGQEKGDEDGQGNGEMAIDEFESKFISSRTTTAISPSSRTAQDESLHEVEHIRPVVENDSGASPPFLPVLLAAYVFVKKDSPFGEDGFPDILQKLGELQLGGERKSGYGRMVLESVEKIADNSLLFGEKSCLWWTGADSITCCPGSILPVHLPLADNALELNGQLEPIVRRLWDKTKGAGQQAQREEQSSLYWTPGSMVKCQAGLELTLGPLGIFLKKEPDSSP